MRGWGWNLRPTVYADSNNTGNDLKAQRYLYHGGTAKVTAFGAAAGITVDGTLEVDNLKLGAWTSEGLTVSGYIPVTDMAGNTVNIAIGEVHDP